MPSKVWVVGEEVLAADFNPYVQEQVVATFANAAARDAAIPAPKPGMIAWLTDVKQWTGWSGTAWAVLLSGVSSPLGVVARAVLAADSATVAGGPTTVAGFTATWTALAGRRYRTMLMPRAQGTANNDQGTVRLSVTGTVRAVQSLTFTTAGREYGGAMFSGDVLGAGVQSAVVTLQLNNGTSMRLGGGAELLVEDVGTI